MKGLAKQQFREQFGRSPWKSTFSKRKKSSWLYLEKLMDRGLLSNVDFSLAEQLLREIPEASEEAAAFICYLSMASKEGHLCVKIMNGRLSPSPAELWKTIWMRDNSLNTSVQDHLELEHLAILIHAGVTHLPQQLLTENPATHLVPSTPIVIWDSPGCKLVYFQKYWNHESLCLSHFNRISESIPEYVLDQGLLAQQIATLKAQGMLLPEQADAVQQACLSSLMILVGGPGTGKTYTAGWIVKLICESLPLDLRTSFEIVLAAPTGKAAANLHHSFSKILTNQALEASVTSSTLHRLLRMHDPNHNQNYLSADLVIVDESSMIDLRVMSTLLSRIKPGARLVFLGDSRQLPPIESGMIFSDLIQLSEQKGCSAGKVELQICMRAELQEIVQLADCIKNGQVDQVFHLLDHPDSKAVSRLDLGENDQIFRQQKTFVKEACGHYSSKLCHHMESDELLRHFQRYRILSPLKKGLFGVETLNDLIAHQVMRESSQEEWVVAPIIVVVNDERLGLFNGDVGVLKKRVKQGFGHLLSFTEGDEVIFANGSEIRKLPAVLLPRVELAYCLSVHKSQGSEFEHVVMVMPEGSEVFGCELFYTGVTRAKRKLEVYGKTAVMREVLCNSLVRLSGICDRK